MEEVQNNCLKINCHQKIRKGVNDYLTHMTIFVTLHFMLPLYIMEAVSL